MRDVTWISLFTNRYLNFSESAENIKFRVTQLFLKVFLLDRGFMDHKKQNLRFYSSNIPCWQHWSSQQICLELKVWRFFLNIVQSRPDFSHTKDILKSFSLKNIRATVFTLI